MFDFLEIEAVITRDKNTINECSHLILPGVGSFGTAMERLIAHNIVTLISENVI